MVRGLAAGQLQVAWQRPPGESWTCGWGIRCLEGLERRAQELHAGLPSLVLGVATAHRWIVFEQNQVAAEAGAVDARGVWTPAGLCSHPGPRQGMGNQVGWGWALQEGVGRQGEPREPSGLLSWAQEYEQA